MLALSLSILVPWKRLSLCIPTQVPPYTCSSLSRGGVLKQEPGMPCATRPESSAFSSCVFANKVSLCGKMPDLWRAFQACCNFQCISIEHSSTALSGRSGTTSLWGNTSDGALQIVVVRTKFFAEGQCWLTDDGKPAQSTQLESGALSTTAYLIWLCQVPEI